MEGRQAQNVYAESETLLNIAACRDCGRLVPHTRPEGRASGGSVLRQNLVIR
jgi:hypothetical protein